MRTIDDAAKLYDALRPFPETTPEGILNLLALRNEVPNLLQLARAQEQEIARIQDQIAMVREQLADADKVVRAVVDKDHIDIGWGKAVVMAREYERKYPALAAIPTSDRERLLEEARAICDAISGMEYNSLVSRTLRQVTELIPKARSLRAKLSK